MLRQLRARLTYANVMSTIAVFGVLGTGGAYAANTVFSTDIVDGEVKSVDIGNGEVNSADVKDQSLTTFDVSTFLGADIVDGTLTGADVSNDSTLGAADIHEEELFFNNTLEAIDIGPNAVGSSEVGNSSLNDEDVAETVLVDFVGGIGVVPANSCVKRDVILSTAVGGDHLVLSANSTDAAANLSYTGEYAPTNGNGMFIKACNPTTSAIDDANTHFSLLAIDAQ